MECPDCRQELEILQFDTYDYTPIALGDPISGQWPKYSSKVYVNNVEVMICECGEVVSIPDIEGLHLCLFGGSVTSEFFNPGDVTVDPYSGKVYMGVWDDDFGHWDLTAHVEQ